MLPFSLLRLAFVFAVADLTHAVTLIGTGVASLSVTQDRGLCPTRHFFSVGSAARTLPLSVFCDGYGPRPGRRAAELAARGGALPRASLLLGGVGCMDPATECVL